MLRIINSLQITASKCLCNSTNLNKFLSSRYSQSNSELKLATTDIENEFTGLMCTYN